MLKKKNEAALNKRDIISELAKSPHGDLTQYLPIGLRAAKEEPEFLAHLISWNAVKGEIRDAKVALPIIGLSAVIDNEYRENALAHLAILSPKMLFQALEFAIKVKTPGNGKRIRLLVERYLHELESNIGKWQRVALQHRGNLKGLYARNGIKPATFADDILFKGTYIKGSVFDTVRNLAKLPAADIAETIRTEKLPFLTVSGALGARLKEPDVLVAIIGTMSSTELVTNTKRLEKLGVKDIPAARAAFEQGLTKASKSSKNMFKTSVAAEAIDDEVLKAKLQGLQERQIQATGGIDGDWLICADKSGSMNTAIEASRYIAAALAKLVKGDVSLVFFDNGPRFINATGKSLEQIQQATRTVSAGGGTNIGCSLQYAIDNKIAIGGIAILSDGGENCAPFFADRYKAYVKAFDVEPTVYFYKFEGDHDVFSGNMASAGIDIQTFDLSKSKVDYYALPNLVKTMRTNRYSLVDEIMATKLLTLDEVMPRSARAQHA